MMSNTPKEPKSNSAFPHLISPLIDNKLSPVDITSFQRNRLARVLLATSRDPLAVTLGKTIGKCNQSDLCSSWACPRCSRWFQEFAVDLVRRLIVEPTRANLRERKSLLTIVPEVGCVADGALSVSILEAVRAEVERALAACAFPACVGGLDVSYNEDETGEVESYWSVHVHCIILDWPSEDQKQALKREMPPTAIVKRPVHIAYLDDDERGVAYPWKIQKVRRVTYLDRSNPDRKPFRNTHIRELRPEQAVLLAKVEHEFGLMRRLLIHGIDLDVINRALTGFD